MRSTLRSADRAKLGVSKLGVSKLDESTLDESTLDETVLDETVLDETSLGTELSDDTDLPVGTELPVGTDLPVGNGDVELVGDTETVGDTEDLATDEIERDIPPAAGDLVGADFAEPAEQETSNGSTSERTFVSSSVAERLDSTVTRIAGQSPGTDQHRLLTLSIATEDTAPAEYSVAPSPAETLPSATTATESSAPPAEPAPAVPEQRRVTLGSVFSDLVSTVLQPLLNPAEGSPMQLPILTAALGMVRDELERIFTNRSMNRVSERSITLLAEPSSDLSLLVDPTDQRVLVIGVDGVNLSRILADPENENFFALMDDATNGPSSIVGHTTISNPSWTTILTGAWGENTGVINNVFTPWAYDSWPTVFNQLEELNPDIDTMAIANWNVINAIAGAGPLPVDQNLFIPQVPGDTNWLATDSAVGAATVTALSGNDAPNFLFSYFVGVDQNGHLYGGASPEYAAAIRNMDENLGAIMDQIAEREKCNPGLCESWTVIVVTDHGHQPQLGFGHGFQSPDETATFVITRGPAFQEGFLNLQYEIVDTTPTVVSLFGGTPRPDSDGVSLTTLGGSDVDPVDLHQALNDAIAMNGYPDILTNVALGVRTVFATVPYLVYNLGHDISAMLPEILRLPVQLIFDTLYVLTNIPAQLVAQLTGVSGASIFPLLPPAPPMFAPPEEAILPDLASLDCGEAGIAAGLRCGESIAA